MKIKLVKVLLTVLIMSGLNSSISFAQTKPAANVQKLALALANPVANLISVPFQNNTVWGSDQITALRMY